jgi:hypothetical protein
MRMTHKADTAELPFNASQFKVFSYSVCYVSDSKAIMSVINFLFFQFSAQIHCPSEKPVVCENVNCIKLTHHIPW